MNLYFCTDYLYEAGLYVAAESRRKAKRMYCDRKCICDFDLVRTYIMCRDYEGPAGAYEVPSQACRACGARL
jgi:hypothetical protein